MFNKMFDLYRDGKLDAAERALEYMTFRAVTGTDKETDDDLDFENDDYEEEEL